MYYIDEVHSSSKSHSQQFVTDTSDVILEL